MQLTELLNVAEIHTHDARAQWWRWIFRVFRFEEAIILGLLICFVVLYYLLPNTPSTPSFQSLWNGFTYNFHGDGTMWMFTLWCVMGTAFMLIIAVLPQFTGARSSKLMHGVWGNTRGPWERSKATLLWGAGGLRTYVPFLACMGIYEMNKRLIPALRGDTLYDMQLAQFDFWLFGDLSASIMHRAMHAEWITEFIGWFGLTQLDIHEACYISYVYAAPTLALAMWFLGRRTQYNRFIGALVICGALTYIGYVLVPVVGPKYVFENQWLLGDHRALSFMDEIKGLSRDCFPSLHTAWTTLFLIAAWKGVRPLFWVYLPIAIGVYIGTLYGGYHYILDIIAGHLLAIYAWWVAEPLREWWNRLR